MEGHTEEVIGVAVTPDGAHAVSASEDRTLRVWDLESGREVCTLEGHTEGLISLALTSDGTRAISGGRDNTLRVWDIEDVV